uniref:Reverse transcriptase zinc-binding domain-containing protein n=1 Tax=Hordeum vulgare subsp. vulgare TaxID=112509 RepID=A0A8I6X722_HORVV
MVDLVFNHELRISIFGGEVEPMVEESGVRLVLKAEILQQREQHANTSNSKVTWKNWAPPRVRFFHWLAHLDRCWTADRLERRGLQHPSRCPICDQAPETMHHLIFACPFARQIWYEVLHWLRLPCAPPDDEPSLNDS